MEGAVVSPSEEDSQTFSIHFSSGEVYKVRAAMARERQMWVDQLRASSTVTSTQGRRGSCRTRSIRISASSICDLVAKPTTTNVDDTFSLVENVLHTVDEKQREVAETIESFPLHPPPSVWRLPSPCCRISVSKVVCLELLPALS